MKTFNQQEIATQIEQSLQEWKLNQNTLEREFKFKNFVEAFSFMTAIALEAEKMDHHPDWSNSYNKVNIALTTHSEKGITQKDFDLAGKVDALFNKIVQA